MNRIGGINSQLFVRKSADIAALVSNLFVFSSPEHKVLKLNYSDWAVTVAHCCLSSVVVIVNVFKMHSLKPLSQISSNFTGMFLMRSSSRLF